MHFSAWFSSFYCAGTAAHDSIPKVRIRISQRKSGKGENSFNFASVLILKFWGNKITEKYKHIFCSVWVPSLNKWHTTAVRWFKLKMYMDGSFILEKLLIGFIPLSIKKASPFPKPIFFSQNKYAWGLEQFRFQESLQNENSSADEQYSWDRICAYQFLRQMH